jgi:hypothetical protein
MCGFLLVLGNFDYSFNDPRALLLYSVRAVMGDFEFDVFEGTQWRHHAPIFIACYSIVIVYVLMSIFGAFIVLLCCSPRCCLLRERRVRVVCVRVCVLFVCVRCAAATACW